jgi:hypothetical protein
MAKSRKPKWSTANQTGVGVRKGSCPLSLTQMFNAFLFFFFTVTAIALCLVVASL